MTDPRQTAIPPEGDPDPEQVEGLVCWLCPEPAVGKHEIHKPLRGIALPTRRFLPFCAAHSQSVLEHAWNAIPMGGAYSALREDAGLPFTPRKKEEGKPVIR